MHIKFLARGKGKGSIATNYIMSEKDHARKVRPTPPIVLRGNPKATGELADSLEFEHKYRSAVIAFHPNDKPTSEQLEEVLNEFEKVAFAGLEQDQYDFCAVLHKEADSEHIHIIVPRVELSSGKSMNIAPPGWRNTYDPLRDLFNEKNGWTSPDISQNPDIARLTQPGAAGTHKSKSAQTRAEIKQTIEQYLTDEMQQGNIENREDIIQSLQGMGFEITRSGKNYITILDGESNTRIRLKGAIYEQHWRLEQTLETENSRATQRDRSADTARAAGLERELKRRISKRTQYNQQRYPKPNPSTSSENKEDAIKSMDTTTPNSALDLSRYLGEQLGSDAIPIISYQEPANRNQQKQANTSNHERSSDIEQMRREQKALRSSRSGRIPGWLQDFKIKIGNLYDRARTEIIRRVESIIESIRAGHDAATAASSDINQASNDLNQAISGSEQIIKRGVRKVIENRVKNESATTPLPQEQEEEYNELSM